MINHVNDQARDDVLVFDDMEDALAAYKGFGVRGHADVCLGVRLRTGAVVVLATRSVDGQTAWNHYGTKLPRGGAALVADRRVIDGVANSVTRGPHRRYAMSEVDRFPART